MGKSMAEPERRKTRFRCSTFLFFVAFSRWLQVSFKGLPSPDGYKFPSKGHTDLHVYKPIRYWGGILPTLGLTHDNSLMKPA
jgi:hypothetical protein